VVQEFFNVALRKMAVPMRQQDAEIYLRQVFMPLMRVTFSQELCAGALQVFSRFNLSWYDSLIVAAAQLAQCQVLYSEDMQHGQSFGSLRVVNPFL
jgi:predicted nucleic acid-binding protein